MEWKEADFWTNKKHWNFLNSIEATFVRTVLLENGGLTYSTALHRPLDQSLPDGSDSTNDLQSQRICKRKRVYLPGFGDDLHPNVTYDAGTKECKKRQSRQPCDDSEDQVVPHLGNVEADKIESRDMEVAVALTNEECPASFIVTPEDKL